MRNGVVGSYGEEFILLQQHFITDEQFLLYCFCIHQADFDTNHKGKYGTFQLTNKQIAEDLGWSEDKVGRNLIGLLEKDILKRINRRTIEVVDYYRFVIKNALKRTKEKQEIVYLREKIAKLQPQPVKLREQNAILRNKTTDFASEDTTISDISSYKVDKVITRSFEDYRRIKEEGGYTMLTEEDMKWIDENVTEDLSIPS